MSKIAEAQAFQSLLDTTGWQLVEAHIRQQIDYRRQRMMDCKTWEEVLGHRSAVESLESVLLHVEQTIREGVEEANGEEVS